MLPIVKVLDIPEKPTCGQLDDGMTAVFSKDWRPDDGMLHVGHWRDSVSKRERSRQVDGIYPLYSDSLYLHYNQPKIGRAHV